MGSTTKTKLQVSQSPAPHFSGELVMTQEKPRKSSTTWVQTEIATTRSAASSGTYSGQARKALAPVSVEPTTAAMSNVIPVPQRMPLSFFSHISLVLSAPTQISRQAKTEARAPRNSVPMSVQRSAGWPRPVHGSRASLTESAADSCLLFKSSVSDAALLLKCCKEAVRASAACCIMGVSSRCTLMYHVAMAFRICSTVTR
mmetsp:Transcript_86227/g.200498  ORF Transcript_86227/g.200498 Transcript_86227/m.200498 type:complete len:201 (+) Transcript_86227:378-980(+)